MTQDPGDDQLLVYVDETGDRGMSEKSSPYFSMAMVAIRQSKLPRLRDAKVQLNQQLERSPQAHIHWSDKPFKRSHDARMTAVEALATLPVRVSYVTIVKADLTPSAGMASDRDVMYNFAVRLCLERSSWMAESLGLKARVNLAHVKRFPREVLDEYLERLRRRDTAIRWNCLHKSIEIRASGERDGLQFADIAAGALDRAIRPSNNPPKRTEPGYLRELAPVLARRQPPSTYCFKSPSSGFYDQQPWWAEICGLIPGPNQTDPY